METHGGSPDYAGFMRDPERIVCLEWRKVRRPQLGGVSSHSWLKVRTRSGDERRLEIFADRGFVERRCEDVAAEDESTIYEDRTAGPHDFSRPLTARILHDVASAIFAQNGPYSIASYNCHHFTLDIWNSVVIRPLQRSHYPDRVKAGMLWGVSEVFDFGGSEDTGADGSDANIFSGLWSGPGGLSNYFASASLASSSLASVSAAAGSRSGVASRSDLPSSEPPLPRVDTLPPLRRRNDDCSSCGLFASTSRGAAAFDQSSRLQSFAWALAAGRVHLFELGKAPAATAPPKAPGVLHAAWARSCLPGLHEEAALRLAERIGTEDVTRLLESELCLLRQSDDLDACFLILRGQREVRLVIFALLRPGPSGLDQQQCVRMFSGDVCAGFENTFEYSIFNHAGGNVVGLARKAQDAFQLAVSTGDWNFVTHS